MDREEKQINEAALEIRKKKQPSKKENIIELVSQYCKGCGLCVDSCPTGTLLLEDNIHSKFGISVMVDAPEYCIGCKMCERRCPDFAIFINHETDKEGK
ncbi:MAG: 4Fe-4S dicluster domain-containing protein [Candidatus Aminicenantes bacterium]|nr:4Fe-4S dicluster domain-containing protein [Candidatus Aminicenantes bacterium]